MPIHAEANTRTSIYHGQPDPFNGNALASCAPSTALLPDGKPIAVLCTQVEQATGDANGSQGFSATLQSGVANRARRWTYNSHGQVLTERDPQNNLTTYTCYPDTTADHTLGDPQSVMSAKNQITTHTKYNKHGQLLESVDPNGITTTHTYDLRQRLLSTRVGGQTTSYEYDAAGQLLKVNLEGGFVHHSNPLFGHPGGIPTTFPTGGLPSAVNSGVWNLRWFADSASHSAAHRWMRGLENAWGGFVNPGTIAIRAARDAADTCTCQQ